MSFKKYILSKQVLLLGLFLCYWFAARPNSIDSVTTNFNNLTLDEQVNYLINIKYEDLVENTDRFIPLLEKQMNCIENKQSNLDLAQILEQLSLAYYISGKYDKSFETGYRALNIYDSLNIPEKSGKMYGEIGYRTKRFDLQKAFSLMQQGIEILLTTGNNEQLAKIYDNYGVLFEMNNQFDSSIFYYKRSLKLKQQLNDKHGLPYTLNNISISYMLSNKPDSALLFLDSARQIRLEINDQIGLAECYSQYGEFYLYTNRYKKAIPFFLIALQKADSLNYPYLRCQMHQKLSECFEHENQPQLALKHYKSHKQLQDSLINIETNKTIANLQIKFETVEKEKKIEQQHVKLKNRSIQLLVLLTFTILIILSFLLFYNRFKHKQKLKLSFEKHQHLIALIEAEEKERTRFARELHDGLGQILSTTRINLAGLEENIIAEDKFLLDNALQLVDQSVIEVRQISHNLMPVSLEKFGLQAAIEEIARQINQTGKVKISTTINLKYRFANNIEHSVYRIIQEIINNILKHADASFINISLINDDENIGLNIINDGKSFDLSKLDDTTGIGWNNIFNRISILNGYSQIVPGKQSGTTINIEIPLKYE
ncbi:MAG: histidine kinase [Bacteroidales bacterium]